MMYAFGARGDCAVCDEPFYAAYLAATGLDHPMRAAILAAQHNDPAAVAAACAGPVPQGRSHQYMKHMTHHMLPGFPLEWARGCANVFLIRHPARVVASYAPKREGPTLEDLGFVQQLRLFEQFAGWGAAPLVIDSTDIRAAPEPMLRGLCESLGLDFVPSMLRWPAGGNAADGVWAAHWYGAVHRSSGFAGAEGMLPELTGSYAELAEQAMPSYEALARYRLRPDTAQAND
jgi:hypothetical protein